MYACLAVTCHLHFCSMTGIFLRATVVTRGWNGYRNKSQHRKSTLEKKILPPYQQGFEPATFQSRVRRSNHWAIPAPGRRYEHVLVLCALLTGVILKGLMFMHACFVLCLRNDCFCGLTWQTVYVYEKSFGVCICLYPYELDCLEVTLCGWQDIKIQLLTN